MADMKAIMQQLSMQEQYDENAKWLNSQKPFLANILIRTVDDFKGMQPEEVVKLIEGEPSVGRTPVEEGFTNERLEDETMAISGMNTEKKVHNEGVTYFDVLFYVRTQNELAKIIVNMELQKEEPALYDVEMRGIFYAAREVSSQLGREFKNQHYNDMKKVYSIWICMNMKEHSLSHIHLEEEQIIGSHKWKGDLDLLNIIIIGIAKNLPEKEEKYELHRLLSALLSSDLEVEDKLDIMEKEYDIPLENDIRKDVKEMCNLSQGIREEAFEEGQEYGYREGQEKGEKQKLVRVVTKMHEAKFPLEQIAAIAEISMEKVKEIIG